jgi:hypothetical protein
MNRVKRSIGISLLCGIGTTVGLTFLSSFAIHFFPYQDKPMIPKLFFIYALAPGIALSQLLAWIEPD